MNFFNPIFEKLNPQSLRYLYWKNIFSASKIKVGKIKKLIFKTIKKPTDIEFVFSFGFPCPYCFKQIIYNDMEVPCPYCETVFNNNFIIKDKIILFGEQINLHYGEIASVLFSRCGYCQQLIRHIGCYHCGDEIDLFAPYDLEKINKDRYE